MATESGENKYNRYGRPALDFIFTGIKKSLKDRSGNRQLQFTRNSVGTYVDENGLIQSATSGEARFDHNPETGESLGLLMEEARTNTSIESQNAGTWGNVGGQTTNAAADVITAPDGTVTADNIYGASGAWTAKSLLGSTVTVLNNSYVVMSIFAKKVPSSKYGFLHLNISIVGASGPRLACNLDTGVVTPNEGVTGYSERLPNGWYRFVAYFQNTSGATQTWGGNSLRIFATTSSSDSSGSGSGTGSTTDGVYVWGRQVEASTSPYATSYIPTSGSTVTRSADVCTVTNSNIYDTDSFTIINQPFGTSAGGSTLTLFDGPQPIKRATVYTTDLGQATINTAAGKTDEFWRWRVLGSSFALPNFATDGQVTVDWGDGTIETLTTSEHTFSNGGGYHDIGFRLDSGTYFRPYINGNASHDTKMVALGPAPESMKLDGDRAFYGCSNLEAFDATVDATGGNNFNYAWLSCSSLTSFPLIDTSAGTNFNSAWSNCTSLTSFPAIDTSSGTNFSFAWNNCPSLTSFPLIDTAAGTDFRYAWYTCSSLTSFPLINTAAGTNFTFAWGGCTSFTSFPLINTAAGTNFAHAWRDCTSLTSFPLINTSAGTDFSVAWQGCTSLTSFPLINTAAGTNFSSAWFNCNNLTSFPLINTAAGTNFINAWYACSSLTSFPLINTAAGIFFNGAWTGCGSLTSFPLINTAAGTSFTGAWTGCSSLTSFPLINTAAGTNFQNTWRDCTSLTSFPLINTAASTSFGYAWWNCTSLTDFPANFFDSWTGTPANSCFNNAWGNCFALTATSVENILNSIDTSGQSAPASGVDITIRYNASSGTPSVATAITNLKSRGWTITLNGVAQ